MSSNTNTKTIEGLRGWQTEMPDHRRKHLDFLMKQWNFTPSNEGNIGDTCYVVRGSLGDSGGDVFFRSNDSGEASYSQWGAAAMYLWSLQGAAPEIIAADPHDPNTYIIKNAGQKNRLLSSCDLDEMIERVLELSKKIHIPLPPTRSSIIELLPPTLAGIYRSVDSRPLPSLPLSISDRLSWGFARAGANNLYQETLAHIEHHLNVFSSAKEQMYLLHGDFQDKNIMETESGNLNVIDPLPCYGARESDLALWAVTLKTKHSIQKTLDTITEKAPHLNKQALTDFAYIFAITEMRPENYENETQTQNRIIHHLLSVDNVSLPLHYPKERMASLLSALYPKQKRD